METKVLIQSDATAAKGSAHRAGLGRALPDAELDLGLWISLGSNNRLDEHLYFLPHLLISGQSAFVQDQASFYVS